MSSLQWKDKVKLKAPGSVKMKTRRSSRSAKGQSGRGEEHKSEGILSPRSTKSVISKRTVSGRGKKKTAVETTEPPTDPAPPSPVKPEPKFRKGDKVLCYFKGLLYDAVVKDMKTSEEFLTEIDDDTGEQVSSRSASGGSKEETGDDGPEEEPFVYFLHYPNWGVRWDEWVRGDTVLAITEETRQEQANLKERAKKKKGKQVKTPKRKAQQSNASEEEGPPPKIMKGDAKVKDEDEPAEKEEEKEFPALELQKDVPEAEAPDAAEADKEVEDVAISTPTVNEALADLKEFLSSYEGVGRVMASAFIQKIRLSFEEFFPFLLDSHLSEYVKRATGGSMKDPGSVVHFAKLKDYFDWIESGQCILWKGEDVALELRTQRTNELQQIMEICSGLFNATKKFFTDDIKYRMSSPSPIP